MLSIKIFNFLEAKANILFEILPNDIKYELVEKKKFNLFNRLFCKVAYVHRKLTTSRNLELHYNMKV